jgi:hypothetical protein
MSSGKNRCSEPLSSSSMRSSALLLPETSPIETCHQNDYLVRNQFECQRTHLRAPLQDSRNHYDCHQRLNDGSLAMYQHLARHQEMATIPPGHAGCAPAVMSLACCDLCPRSQRAFFFAQRRPANHLIGAPSSGHPSTKNPQPCR